MLPGRTYTLNDENGSSRAYFQAVRRVVDGILKGAPDPGSALKTVRNAEKKTRFPGKFIPGDWDSRHLLEKVERSLAPFLGDVEGHVRTLSLVERLDPILGARRKAYLLYMLEVELTNRVNAAAFKNAPWKMALIAHCLKDFRPGCRAVPGTVEEVCAGCDQRCLVNSGTGILRAAGVEAFISVSMDHRELFGRLMKDHPGMAALGIACIPELVMGMRLCEGLGIPAVGVPLDANRCGRWMGECLETTFSLEELERVLKNR